MDWEMIMDCWENMLPFIITAERLLPAWMGILINIIMAKNQPAPCSRTFGTFINRKWISSAGTWYILVHQEAMPMLKTVRQELAVFIRIPLQKLAVGACL